MAYVAPETVTPTIEIVDQPEEQAEENQRTFRFSLPIILGFTLLAIFFLFQRRYHSKN